MNRIDQGPVFQLLTCSTEILQGLPVEKLHLAPCTRRGHETGNVVDDLPPGEFSCAHRFLSPLPILDICTGSVPLEDVARFIPQRIGANQEPSIRCVETTNSRFRIDLCAR